MYFRKSHDDHPGVFLLHDDIIDRLFIIVQLSINHQASSEHIPTTNYSSMERSSRSSQSQKAKSQDALDCVVKLHDCSEGNECFHEVS